MSQLPLLIFSLIPQPKKNIGISGSDIRLINILKNTPKKNTNITIVGTKNLPLKLTANKIRFKYIPIKSIKSSSLINVCFFSLVNILKTFLFFKPKSNSIIYSSSDLYWETIPAFFYRPKVKSWIQIIHHIYPNWQTRPGNPIINFFGFYLQRFSFLLIKKKADAIIVINPQVKQELVKLNFKKQKIFISSNGIDLNLPKPKIKDKKYDAVFLGRLDPSKGLNDFVPIWSKVCLQNPKAKLALIGGGTSRNFSQLKKMISASSLNQNIKIFGFIDEIQKENILSQSKLFIFPSHEEGWGIAIAEAMLFKLPVICWGLKNLKQIFKNHVNYVKPFNYQQFSDIIINLLNQPTIVKSQGKNNQKFIKQFSWYKIANQEYKIIKYNLKTFY